MFDALVESGELPPVEERLPENPCLIHEFLDEYLDPEIGNFGGTLRFVTNSVNWDADVFVGMTEGLLTMQSSNSDQVDPNIVESYEANEDNTVFTFKLRKGLKLSLIHISRPRSQNRKFFCPKPLTFPGNYGTIHFVVRNDASRGRAVR